MIFSYHERMNQYELPGVSAVEKGLELFLALVEASGTVPLSEIAQQTGVPISTAHRLLGPYLRCGLLSRIGRGRYSVGLRLATIAQHADTNTILINASRPPLRRLARDHGLTVHLGVLEGDMVTYLVKEHGGGMAILTQEMNQLEGYGSALGKVLLAHLDGSAQDAYLAGGPFVPLTTNTITDPGALRESFQIIRQQGYAFDNAEVDAGLYCLAVPVPGPDGNVHCAISLSCHSQEPIGLTMLPHMQHCVASIRENLGLQAKISN